MVVRPDRLHLLELLGHCGIVSWGFIIHEESFLPERVHAAFVLLGRCWRCASSASVGTVIGS